MDDILPTLGTIARINRGDKLRVKGKNLDIDNRYGQFIWRLWDKEGRDSTITHLKSVYQTTKSTVEDLLLCVNEHEQKDKEDRVYKNKCRRLRDIANGLGKSFAGIKNLETTYEDYPSILAELECIIGSIIEPLYKDICKAMKSPEFQPNIYKFGSVISNQEEK